MLCCERAAPSEQPSGRTKRTSELQRPGESEHFQAGCSFALNPRCYCEASHPPGQLIQQPLIGLASPIGGGRAPSLTQSLISQRAANFSPLCKFAYKHLPFRVACCNSTLSDCTPLTAQVRNRNSPHLCSGIRNQSLRGRARGLRCLVVS